MAASTAVWGLFSGGVVNVMATVLVALLLNWQYYILYYGL